MINPEVIAVAGDWHGNTKWALHAINYAATQGANVILHTGDFGYDFNQEFLDKITKHLKYHDMTLYFVDGNHEDFFYLYTFPIVEDGTRHITDRVFHLPRGFRWEWLGNTFMALGGAISPDKEGRVPYREWWPDEALSFADISHATRPGNVDIMITHDCPAGVDIPGIANNPYGFPAKTLRDCEAHRDVLRGIVDEIQPKLLVHGHYHQYYRDVLYGGDYMTNIMGLHCDGSYVLDNVRLLILE